MRKDRYKTLDKLFKIGDAEDLKTPAHDNLWLKCQEPEKLVDILRVAGISFRTRLYCHCCSHCTWDWNKSECECLHEEQKEKVKNSFNQLTNTLSSIGIDRRSGIVDFDKFGRYLHAEGKLILEMPVKAPNGFVVGFVDIFVDLEGIAGGEYFSFGFEPCQFFIEVKPKIQSIGELIRQIALYREYLKRAHPIVVTNSVVDGKVFDSQKISLYIMEGA